VDFPPNTSPPGAPFSRPEAFSRVGFEFADIFQFKINSVMPKAPPSPNNSQLIIFFLQGLKALGYRSSLLFEYGFIVSLKKIEPLNFIKLTHLCLRCQETAESSAI
jgi:hypothetical protein